MNRETTATFIGHSECFGIDENLVRGAIIDLIENHGITEFLNGGMGDFDILCARLVRELKGKYPHVKCHLVIPYLTKKITDRTLFDEIIYPEGLEKYHFKAAIPARNKYLVESSAWAVCYITHNWGGAAKTYDKAVKSGVRVVNVGG